MSGFLLLLILSEVLLPNLTCAYRVRRQTTKVRISAIGDTIMLKFLQPNTDTRLEGYILGYGSSLFSKQLIQLPEDGELYETEIDAEPKYLVVVQPVKGEEKKKECTGKESLEKPLHLVIGSVTETSVMLSWGTLLNTLSTETNPDDCIEDGQYTVRYREKEPKKTWNFQTCPTRDTVIDQLKPETPYEFGVRAESRNITGAWSPPVIHNTAAKDTNIYTPLKPENILKPKKPITESPPTFSPLVPVSQSKPASLLKHPEPPPTQRATLGLGEGYGTGACGAAAGAILGLRSCGEHNLLSHGFLDQVLYTVEFELCVLQTSDKFIVCSACWDWKFIAAAKDIVIPKPLKPENPLRPKINLTNAKPVTEIPQTFSPSVPVLHSVTQSRSASLLSPSEPPPTQRVTQDIHKPLKPEIYLSPDKPITESLQTFSPSLPVVTQSRPTSVLRQPGPPPTQRVMQVLPNVTERRPSLLLRHTAPPPIPRVTLASPCHTAPSQSLDGHHTKPVLASGATNRNQGQDLSSPLTSVPSTSAFTVTKRVSPVPVPNPIRSPPTYSNTSVRNPQASHDEKHKGRLWNKRHKWNKKKTESNEIKNQLNQVDKVKEKVIDLKVVDALPILKPSTSTPTTEIDQKPTPTTTPFFAYNGSRYNMGDNSSVFSSLPISDLDPMGKKRFVGKSVLCFYYMDVNSEEIKKAFV
ncbi:target of Nesh-SH3 isoform X2 [Tachysurus ichikawai]